MNPPISEAALGIRSTIGIFRFTRDLIAPRTNSESADFHSLVHFWRSRKRENSESGRGRRGRVLVEQAEFTFRSRKIKIRERRFFYSFVGLIL